MSISYNCIAVYDEETTDTCTSSYAPDPDEQDLDDGFTVDTHEFEGGIESFEVDGEQSEQITGSVRYIKVTMDSGTTHTGWATEPTYQHLLAKLSSGSGVAKWRRYRSNPTQGSASYTDLTFKASKMESVDDLTPD